MDTKSKGHVGFIGGWEYFKSDTGDLFRAPAEAGMDIYGYRMGSRFEASAIAAEACLAQAYRNATQAEIKVTLFNPTSDPANFAVDIYHNGERVYMGYGGMSREQAFNAAMEWLKGCGLQLLEKE